MILLELNKEDTSQSFRSARFPKPQIFVEMFRRNLQSSVWKRYVSANLSPPQRFKHSLYQSAVRSVPQAQSRMDRSGGEPLPDVRRFLVHPCRFLVHRWISRLWLHLTA